MMKATGMVTVWDDTDFHLYMASYNKSVVAEYYLPFASKVNLDIYSIDGKKVTEITQEQQASGKNKIAFSTANISKGIYFLLLSGNGITQSQKLLIE